MKKKILLISGGLLTFVIVITTIFIVNKNSTNNETVMKDKIINNNSFLTLMLEQSDGTYAESTSNTWPGKGYIFNKELSSCQNGGELDYDSENNKVILYNNKSDGCYVYFDLYNKPVINSINLGEVTNNSITITVNATNGTNPISNYYYIINDGVPISTTSNTYTFSGLDSGTTYTIKVYVVDTERYESDISSLNVETKNGVYLADFIKSLYTSQGSNGIYYHTSSLANSAADDSYRYAGANPNNYVCFGSDITTCPSDNLYRIIGVFGNLVKLIKADYPTISQTGTGEAYFNTYESWWSSSYYTGNQNMSLVGVYTWNPSKTNTWSNSVLTSENLNTTFLNSLDPIYRNQIADATWYVDGYSTNSVTPSIFQGAESTGTTWIGKIGLMYVSDYGFSASNNYWTTNLSSYGNASNNNWLYLGAFEWTISRVSSKTGSAYYVYNSDGNVRDNGSVYNHSFAIRPCFYLNSDVQYASGSGTESDPIRLVV
ncbi:MAG TPA: hypothetical protein IAB65_01525 [Candidatus Onthocola stercorigallinarum]|mgnify:CR=1 FL=1|nr:hypothetical protein [Candidatus Onthocola stercorigallinarum]